MDFRVLGPLEVVGTGGPRAPAGAKERSVLACLLLEPGRGVPADELLAAAWPDAPRAVAARSLAVRLANLRAFLEPERPRGAPSSLLRHRAGAYALAVEPDQVDAQRFAALVARAAGEPPEAALATCEAALRLWRGPPFPELAHAELAQAELHRLEELRAQAVERRMRALLELGRHDAALPELRRLVAAEPWREALVRALALALYRSGRQVEALDVLRALAGELRELGLDPSPETRAVEQRILLHDDALAAPAPAPAAPAPAAPAPAPAPVPRAPVPLPVPASRFVGREDDLARAVALAEHARLVTVTGVGGAGKTRLALELAARVAGALPDGCWWCELAPLEPGGDVAGAVADALGVEPVAGDAKLERIAAHLAPRRALLLLDNCEHVLDGAAAVAQRLIERCPDLCVLATSRAPLGVEGEQVMRLPGLPAAQPDGTLPGPAATLFLDRARAAGGPVDADLEAVAEICRRLDGLPLAIELAAGRARSLAAAEIAARLDARFALLAPAGRRATARHATLRTAVDWSYELLGEPQRRVFERLGVFHRGCGLEAAQAVCAGGEVAADDVPALLDELVAHSMVVAEAVRGRTRYRMLETLRAYALERLEARDEAAGARDRHAAQLAARVERALRRAGRRAPDLPRAHELEDVAAAVRWCAGADADPGRAFLLVASLWTTAIARHAEEIALLAEETLARRPEPHPARGAALGTAATARMSLGDAEAARAHAEAAVALGGPALVARRVLCGIAYQAGDLREALRLARDLAGRARAAGDEPLCCEAYGFVVQLLHAGGDVDEAVWLAGEMRALADRLGAPFLVSWSRYASGVVLLDRDAEAARRWLEESLAVARATSQPHMERYALRALALAAIAQDRRGDAAAHLLAALALREDTVPPVAQWATLMAAGALLADRGVPDDAAALLAGAEAWPAAPLLASLGPLAELAERARGELAARMPPERLAAAQARGRALDVAEAKALARARLSAPAG